MKTFEEKICLCALNRIFGFEPKVALALIRHLGSASEVFRLSDKEIDTLLGPYSKYRGKITPQAVENSAQELETLSQKGISFCGWSEECYPKLLKECEDAPVGLYIRGNTDLDRLWKPARRIAIVGTRDISPYGREWCEKTVIALSRCQEKPVIVSGLALGTDICAHKTALKCGLDTIGVMATGPESIYPYRHRDTAETMISTEGCALVTDYPPGTSPLAVHFLRRNRIIAGLCEAVILIESKIKGGGMMTARLAYSYNRDVYTLPGRIDDIRSQGCNLLVKSKTAEPFTSVDDLIDSLGLTGGSTIPENQESQLTSTYNTKMSKDKIEKMSEILLAIRGQRGITLEELVCATNLDYSTIVQLTCILETDGYIRTDLMQRCTINNTKR